MSRIVRPEPDRTAQPVRADAGGGPTGPASSDSYREGMSRLATAVSVIATDGVAGLAGFTATAVASVSDDPPTLLVCLQRQAQSAQRLLANAAFSVNVLAADQRDVAEVFAGRTGLHLEDRFGIRSRGAWIPGTLGIPVLEHALAAFECRLVEAKDVATHHVLFGEVAAVHLGASRSSLIYCGRQFRAL